MKDSKKPSVGTIILTVILSAVLLIGSFTGGFFTGRATILQGPGLHAVEAPEDLKEQTIPDTSKDAEPVVKDTTYVEGNYITSQRLASVTLDKYKDSVSPYGYTYGDPINGLKRTDSIELKTGFDLDSLGIQYWTGIVKLCYDPELKDSVSTNWDYDEDNGKLTITPGSYPFGEIYVSSIKTDIVRKYTHDDIFFFPHDAGSAWGNTSTMYLATYIDLETGEKLDTPIVSIVSLEGELSDTPRLSYSFTDDGRVRFDWSSVEGASEYFVCRYSLNEDNGRSGGLSYIASTTDTYWSSDSPEYGSMFTNQDFRYDGEDGYSRYIYCVIAISDKGTSMMSNCVDILDLIDNLPVSIDYETWLQNGYSYQAFEKVDDLCAYSYITMANGENSVKLIDYDTEKAFTVEERYITTDDEGNYLEGNNVNVLKIPYRIEGTPFEDTVSVIEYNELDFSSDLKYIEERENMLRKRAGEITLSHEIKHIENDTVPENVREVDCVVTANSALSEYLARNMLSGVTMIDVSDFRESSDIDLLADAIMEAYYQNPLILGISGYRINRSGSSVSIEYENSAFEEAEKQKEIEAKAQQIVSKIISSDMSELEKELAINTYLCDTCTYSDAALENAEKNEFLYVDDEFKDAFNAYGAIINGDCVCAGYAAAFKILADLSGLESVVVTGVLEGNLPHAWNKVKVDGEWEILDVTNNDNEFLTNALFNLPDAAGSKTLTEDNDYIMDSYLRNYSATNGAREYYRINELYYDYDEIGEELAKQINDRGVALLRTDYELDDETFNRIASDVYDIIGYDKDLYGYYWMGVIYLTLDES